MASVPNRAHLSRYADLLVNFALGRALQPCYDGGPDALSDDDWTQLGFNDSAIYTDIVSTTDRTVTAVLRDGSTRTIYVGGHFQVEA